MEDCTRRDALRLLGGAMAAQLAAGAASGSVAKPRIKVGQIGVGHAHATKLKVFRASPDYEVVGVVEPDEALRREAKSNAAYRGVPWMTQEELLAAPGLQAVLVEMRVRDSLDVAEACVAAGKHIHLDKPAGESLPRFRRILDAAAKRKLVVQMGYMYRYNPAVRLMRDFLQRGWLGEPFEVHTVMSKVVPPERRGPIGEYKGGIMFELGCHLIDLVVGVLGKPDKVTPYSRRVVESDDQLMDNMLAVFEYPRALATVKSSAVEVAGQRRRRFSLCGTEGTFHIQPLDSPAARVTLSKGRGKYAQGFQELAFPKFRRYEGDAADMARMIRGEKPNDFSCDHDLAVQTAVLEASRVG